MTRRQMRDDLFLPRPPKCSRKARKKKKKKKMQTVSTMQWPEASCWRQLSGSKELVRTSKKTPQRKSHLSHALKILSYL